MQIETAITILTYTGLAVALIGVYIAVSFGPYMAGREVGKTKLKRELIRLSLESPEKFEAWLAREQVNEALIQTKIAKENLLASLPRKERKLFRKQISFQPATDGNR